MRAKTVVITGGTSGIGEVVAVALAKSESGPDGIFGKDTAAPVCRYRILFF